MFQNGVNCKRDSKSLDACVRMEVLQRTNGAGMVTILFGVRFTTAALLPKITS